MTRKRSIKSKHNPNTESIELLRQYRLGKIRYSKVLDYHSTRYGFKSYNDFLSKMKYVVMSMIHLNQNYIPTPNTKTKYEKIKELYEQYEDTILYCACCGEEHNEFLNIDHVNNNGAEHRRETSKSSMSRILFKDGFKASDYQILCFNCNSSLGNYGYCPHNPEIKREHNGSKRLRTIEKE